MIPFFLVSALLLLGFTYSYGITYDGAEVDEDGADRMIKGADRMLKKKAAGGSILASKCNDSLGTCFMGVLSAFLSGGTEGLNDFNDVLFGLIIVLVVSLTSNFLLTAHFQILFPHQMHMNSGRF